MCKVVLGIKYQASSINIKHDIFYNLKSKIYKLKFFKSDTSF